MDHAVGRDHGDVFEHEGFEAADDVRVDGEGGCGDEGVGGQGEEPGGVRVEG